MQFRLQNTRAVCNLDSKVVAMALQPPVQLEAAEVAGEWLLSVHPEDVPVVCATQTVPLFRYAATGKFYIGLRKDEGQADDRAMQLLHKKDGSLTRSSLKLLRFQFTHKGFSYYANKLLGQDYAFCPMFYKNVYSRDNTGIDYGAWSFHGDLALVQRDEAGHLLIVSDWVDR